MDYDSTSRKIDNGTSTNLHKYYQKILVNMFVKEKDPFGRKLTGLEVEHNMGKGVADLFLQWDYKGKMFSEIIEVELKPSKSNLEKKINLYKKHANLLSLCVPSRRLEPLISTFKKMKKDLWKINFVYIIDDEMVTKHKRKIVDERGMFLVAHSPFLLMQCEPGDFKCVKELVNSRRGFLFEAFLYPYLK